MNLIPHQQQNEQIDTEREEQNERHKQVLAQIEQYEDVEIPERLAKRINELTSHKDHKVSKVRNSFSQEIKLKPVMEADGESVDLTSEEEKSIKT